MRKLYIAIIFSLIANYSFADTSSDFSVIGTVTASSCSVVVGDKGARVVLPLQRMSALASAGDTAGETAFKLSVTGCAASGKNSIFIYFQNAQANINSAGRLLNTAAVASAATNVELQILDHNKNLINLSSDKDSQKNVALVKPSASAPAIFDFYVRYYAVGAATAGKVESTLTFLVESF